MFETDVVDGANHTFCVQWRFPKILPFIR